MRTARVAVILALILVAVPLLGQGRKVYFSVSTSKTFMPGEKPLVRLYARNVDVLEFRVYRIKDPFAFFSKLDNVHSFGMHIESNKEIVDERTLLERFHDWKHHQWTRLRNFFRDQYSFDNREKIRDYNTGKAQRSGVIGAAGFAQVPLLNSKQLVARWKMTLPPTYVSESSDLPIDSLPSGAYLVEATDGTYKAYTVVLVSEVALVVKSWTGQLTAFTTDRKTGDPVKDCKVNVWRKKKPLAQFTTGVNGLGDAKVIVEQGTDSSYGEGDEWVLAQCGDDVAMVAPYTLQLSSDPSSDWLGYVYTDRPVYRPGHTVSFKAILRKRNGDALGMPTEKEVMVRITDAANTPLLQKQFTLSLFGTLHGSIELPATAALGYYSISVGNTAAGTFQVEEYKKPEYWVKVTPSATRVLQGAPLSATIEARYFFGEPVANATVKYVVHTSRAFEWDDQEDDYGGAADFSEVGDEVDDGGGYGYGSTQVSEISGKLDSNGKLVVNIPTPVDSKNHADQNYYIEARVTDAANREIAGHNSVLVTYGPFKVSVRAQSYVYKQGEAPSLQVKAVDYDNHPVKTSAKIELLPQVSGKTGDPILSTEVTTGDDGLATANVQLRGTGSFVVRVTAPTSVGRSVTDSTWLWVSGTGEQYFEGQENQIQLVVDKPSYKIGDTAHVLIMTGVPNSTVLVTSEGKGIINKQVVHATTSSVLVDIPIVSESQPNFFASAVFVRDDKIYSGRKNLKVPAVDERLAVEIVPAKQQFQPGEAAVYNITTKDAAGKPVSAEVSIGIVDDAIYSVRPDNSGDIVNAFYPKRYGEITTENSLSFYFQGEAGRKTINLASSGFGPRRGLAQIKDSGFALPKVRKAFPDTAYWAPEVRTDSAGHATVSMTFPDSLTTWRATARAITTDTRAGAVINKVIVRKNLILRLAVPRFFRQGDEVVVAALVHNYLDSTKTARVSLDVAGADVLSGSTQDVTVPNRGEAKVEWRLRPQVGTSVKLTGKALTNEESDAMELTLPVIPFGVKQAVTASGALVQQSETKRVSLAYPATAQPGSHSLDIEMAPSVTAGIFGALDYLTSFPYGCTEQTMSSFLPNVVVANTMKELKLKSTIDNKVLGRQVDLGFDRLWDFQHEDGGWGWWKEDDSTVFMTAYVVSGVAQARAAGFPGNNGNFDRGREYLKKALADHPRMIANLQAYVVFALAQADSADTPMLNALWDKKDKLSPEGIAIAGLAMQKMNDPRASRAVELLRAAAKPEADVVYWPADSDVLMEIDTDSSAEATAYAVRLISKVAPTDPLLPKAVEWMMRHRNEGYYWSSTKQTAMVIYGMVEYLKISKELDAAFDAEVLVNGKQVAKTHFSTDDATSGTKKTVHLPDAQVAATNQIEIRKSGAGRLYWSASAPYYSKEKSLYHKGSFSLNISRDYFRLAKVQSEEKITYNVVPLSGPVQIGDVLAVRVTVSGGRWKYLLMEDPVAAGTEFIERADLYEINQKPDWWMDWYTRREFHDDHAAIFQTTFDQQKQYFYLLKVVNPGAFKISPASVQPMYQPDVLATTEPAALEVK